MGTDVHPVSAVIPTRNRAGALGKTLESLAGQSVLPAELIVVDGSEGAGSREVVERWGAKVAQRSLTSSPRDEGVGRGPRRGDLQPERASSPLPSPPSDGREGEVPAPPQCVVRWLRAEQLGAAVQRNQGVAAATQPFIWFFDDDILFEPECVNRLWRALQSDAKLGGVNAMVTNQRYQPPGMVSRTVFTILHGGRETSFAGRVLGPAVNLLPEDRDDLPEVVPVEWLNTTCTLYRREALPSPAFDSVFTGYSMMEDLTLSLRVGRNWRLANARTARIFHDSQPGSHKSDASDLAEMELVNRHYVMTRVLGRRRLRDYFRLSVWETFQLVAGRSQFGAKLRGQTRALKAIVKHRDGESGLGS